MKKDNRSVTEKKMTRKLTDGKKIVLQDMLEAREKRAARQTDLIHRYQVPVISFGLNIAGPVKKFPLADLTFEAGCEQIRIRLKSYGIRVLHEEENRADTGNEAFFCTDADPAKVKKIVVELEEEHTLGRLFDIDVIKKNGEKVSRTELGIPERTCLLCGKPAFECSRSRAHSTEELFTRTCTMMWDYFARKYAEDISFLAVRALLYEVMATPKPGLVDQHNTGSHRDMDIFTFETSALAVLPYFTEFVSFGTAGCAKQPEQLLEGIRPIGIQAEIAMRRATGGVNTHKGIIFSMGIICTALGWIYGNQTPNSREALMNICKRISAPLLKELEEIKNKPAATNGERLLRQYGVRGIRGEAADGFPTLFNVSVPRFYELINAGFSLNDAGIVTLVSIMAATEDTNLITRSSYEKAQEIRKMMKELVSGHFEEKNYYVILEDLDARFIRDNLSPGGSADLLALTYFLYFYETGRVPRTAEYGTAV